MIVSKEQAEAVGAHSSALVQTLLTNGQSKLKEMEICAQQVEKEIGSSVQSLLDTIASHASAAEKQVNEQYNGLAGNYLQNADSRLSDFADELSTLHDTTTEQLEKEADQFSSQLLAGSAKVQEGLQTRCDEAVKTANGSFNAFKLRLEERLQLSRGQKQALEKDKNRILVAVQNELLSIQDSFSKKILALLSEAKLGLDEETESVEKKITAAVETCNEQVSASATSIQKQINNDVEKFLQLLSSHHNAALSEISASAQGNLPGANPSGKEEKVADSPQILFSTVSNIPEQNMYKPDSGILETSANENEYVKEVPAAIDLESGGDSLASKSKTRRNKKLRNEETENEDTEK